MKDDVFTIRDRQTLEHNEYLILSPFAAKSREWSQTRMNCDDEHAYRTAFQRDRDRIIHSRAFRRLKHKRQVFLITYGDHYRTRLTHTLEVSQLSRTIARALGLNEDLAEAIALGHDLGHTPFGHVGEMVLHLIMSGEDDLDGAMLVPQTGGFKHNYQSLRIVDVNEKKYEMPGLNLTAAVREGILKHTRLRRNALSYPDFHAELLNYKLDHAVTLEGQIVGICDEIAQRTHDLEDGIRAGYVSMQDVRTVPLIRKMEAKTGKSLETENGFMFRNQLIRYLVDFLVSDVIQSTQNRLRRFYELTKRQQFYDSLIVWFSDELNPLQEDLDRFIMQNIIGVAVEQRSDTEAVKIIRSLFKFYYLYPNQLPTYRLQQCTDADTIDLVFSAASDERFATIQWLQTEPAFVRAVCDHIAGMTDNYAEREASRLASLPAAELKKPADHQPLEL